MEDYYLSRGAKTKYQRMLKLIQMYNPEYQETSGQFAEEVSFQGIDFVILPIDLQYLATDLEKSAARKIISSEKYSVYQIQ